VTDSNTRHAYIGLGTDPGEDGIVTVAVDTETGAMEQVDAVDAGNGPGFLAFDPPQDHLYAINQAGRDGRILAFDIDAGSHALTRLNDASSGGAGPCHCSVDAAGEFVFVANYGGGTVSMLPIADDGTVEPPSCTIQHEGSGPNEGRQSEAHPHSIRPGPDDRFAYAPDLGTDRVEIYRIDRAADDLVPADVGPATVHGGAGPRHLDFHPDAEHVYLINELDSTLTTFVRDPDTGGLTEQSRADTLPPDGPDDNYTAEVIVHPSGRFLYGSNRGHDSIAVFDLADPDDPELVETTSTRGEWPRNFVLDPDGKFLFAENKNTDDVQAFRIDPDDGTLAHTGHEIAVDTPICMRFIGAD
jgi:6-phosphogluconolactonase